MDIIRLSPHHAILIFMKVFQAKKSSKEAVMGYDDFQNKHITSIIEKIISCQNTPVKIVWSYDDICQECIRNPNSRRYAPQSHETLFHGICDNGVRKGRGEGIYTVEDWINGYNFTKVDLTDDDCARIMKLEHITKHSTIPASKLFSHMSSAYEKISDYDKSALELRCRI